MHLQKDSQGFSRAAAAPPPRHHRAAAAPPPRRRVGATPCRGAEGQLGSTLRTSIAAEFKSFLFFKPS